MACCSGVGILSSCSEASASLCIASHSVKLLLPVYSHDHTRELQRIDRLKYSLRKEFRVLKPAVGPPNTAGHGSGFWCQSSSKNVFVGLE